MTQKQKLTHHGLSIDMEVLGRLSLGESPDQNSEDEGIEVRLLLFVNCTERGVRESPSASTANVSLNAFLIVFAAKKSGPDKSGPAQRTNVGLLQYNRL